VAVKLRIGSVAIQQVVGVPTVAYGYAARERLWVFKYGHECGSMSIDCYKFGAEQENKYQL
jgi:hypothetical protein